MADTTPPKLRVITEKAPVAGVVDELKALLKRAETGEIRAVAFAYYTDGHATGHNFGWDSGIQRESLVGELHLLQVNLLLSTGRIHAPRG